MHKKLAEAAEYLKAKMKIAKLQTDCIHRVEAMYLSKMSSSIDFSRKCFMRKGMNGVECSFTYDQDFFTRLIVDEKMMHIDSLENNEAVVIEAMLKRCKTSNLYVLHGTRRADDQRNELILEKGTTLEQLLIEKDLKLRGF